LSRRTFYSQLPPEQPPPKEKRQQQSDQIVLELRADGSYAVNNQPVSLSGLDAKLHEIYDNRPAKLMFIKAAGNRKYKEVIEAMDLARGAGVQVIAFTPADKAKTAGGGGGS